MSKEWSAPALPPRDGSTPLPPLTERGAEPDRRLIFEDMLSLWEEKVSPPDAQAGASSRLAEWLDVHRQHVSTWRSTTVGGQKRNGAPWWVLLAMADYLGLAILITADGHMIIKKPVVKAKKSAESEAA